MPVYSSDFGCLWTAEKKPVNNIWATHPDLHDLSSVLFPAVTYLCFNHWDVCFSFPGAKEMKAAAVSCFIHFI